MLTDRDMGARHRARPGSIQIMKVQVIPASKVRSKNLRQFLVCRNTLLNFLCNVQFNAHCAWIKTALYLIRTNLRVAGEFRIWIWFATGLRIANINVCMTAPALTLLVNLKGHVKLGFICCRKKKSVKYFSHSCCCNIYMV